MPLLAQLVVEYVADLSNLEAGAQKAIDLIDSFGSRSAGPANLTSSFDAAANSAQTLAGAVADASSASKTTSASMQETADATNNLATSFKDRAVSAADDFSAKIASLASPITNFASDLSDKAGSALSSFGERLQQAAQPAIDFGDRLKSGIASGVDAMQVKLIDAALDVASFTEKLSSGASQIFSRVSAPFEQAGLVISGFGIKAQDAVSSAIDSIKNKFASVSAPVMEFGQKVMGALPSLSEMREQVSNAGSSIGSFVSRLSEGASSLLRFGTSAEEAGSPLQGFGSRIKEAGSNLLDLGSKIGMAVMGFQGLMQGAESLAKALFEPNASMEQTRVSFEAFLGVGKKTQTFLDTLSNFAATTPFEFADAQQGALNLLNMGVAANQVNTYLSDIGDAVSKVGGNGTVFQAVTGIIEQMGVAGKITTGDMMQLTDRNIPAFQILAKAMGVPVDTLQDMISRGELGKDKIDLLVQAMGKFGNGAMIAQGKTFNGLLSTVKDNASAAWRSFTGPLFDQAKGSLTDIGNLVGSKQFQNFAKGAGVDVGNVIKDIGSAAKYVSDILRTINLTPFKNAWKSVSDEVHKLNQRFGESTTMLKPVADAFDPFAETIRSLATGGLKIVTDLMNDFAGALKTIIQGSQGIGPLQTIPGIIQKIKDTVKNINFKPFVDLFDTVKNINFKQVAEDLKPLVQGLLNLSPGAEMFKALSDHAKDLGTWFRNSVIPALKDAEPGFANLAQSAGGLFLAFLQISQIIGNTFQSVFSALLPVFMVIIPIIIQVAGIISNVLGAAITFLTPYILQATQAIGQFATDIATRVAPILIQFAQSVEGGINDVLIIWNAVWPYLAPILQGVWTEIVGIVQIAWAILTGLIKVGLDVLSGNWSQAWTDVKDMFVGIWNGIQTTFEGAMMIIQGTASGLVNGIIALFQYLYDVLVGHSIVPDMVNAIIFWFAGLPGRAAGALSGLVSYVAGPFLDLASSASMWMNDMMSNMVGTINSWAGNIQGAANNIGGIIRGILGHSTPSMGPMKGDDMWMVDFGSNLVDGLNSQVSRVQAAALNIGSAIAGASGTANIGISGVGASPSSVSASRSAQTVYVVMDSGGSDDHATNVYLDSEVLLKAMTKRERKTLSRRNKS